MSDEINERIEILEERISSLSRLAIEARTEALEAREAIRTTTELYEQRLDQVYRRVSVSLREFLGLAAVDTQDEVEADAVLAKAFGAVLAGTDGVSVADLRASLAPNLKPGIMTGPLTIRGFKLNRAAARELGHAILLTGTVPGIAVYGPYKPLAPGRYELVARLLPGNGRIGAARPGELALDVYQPDGDVICSVVDRPEPWGDRHSLLRTQFDWPGGGVEFRLLNNMGASWQLERFDLTDLKA